MGNSYSGSCLKTNIAQIGDGDIKKSDLEKLIKPCKVKKNNSNNQNNQQNNPNRSGGQGQGQGQGQGTNRPWMQGNRPDGTPTNSQMPAATTSMPPSTNSTMTEGFSMDDYGNSSSMMMLIWIILIIFLIYAAYKYSAPKNMSK